MGRHDHAHGWSCWGQWDGWAIKEGAGHLAFRVRAGGGGSSNQHGLHDRQIQQVVVLVARDHSQASCQHIREWSGTAIEAVEADHDLLSRDADLLAIAQQNLDGPQQFAPVIAVARPPKVPRN